MTDQKDALRQQAEEMAAHVPEDLTAHTPEEIKQTLQELRVHQIELEMQNEELRRAQVELDATRERYFDLYDLAPVGYCTLSEQGQFLEANLTVASLLGVARGALLKQFISRYIFKQDQDIYYQHRQQLFETGDAQVCELRMLKKDGTGFWAHLTATAAQDPAGAPVCRVALSDVTQRKQAEATLKQSEAQYRLLTENIKDVVWILDTQTLYFRYVSPSVERLRGYTPEEIMAEPVTKALTPAAGDNLVKQMRQRVEDFLAGGQSFETFYTEEAEQPRKDGSTVWTEAVTSYYINPDNGRVEVRGVSRDISERKRAEAELVKSKALLSEAERAGKIGGWEFYPETATQTWTDETFRILEVDLTQGAPKVPEGVDFIAPAYRPMAVQAIQRAIEFGESYEQDWEIITTRGNHRWVHVIGNVHQEQGKTISVSGSFQDITERKQAEAALRESEERFRMLFDRAPLGYQSLDADGRFIDTNQAWLDTLGYTRQEVIGHWFGDFLAAEFVEAFRQRFPIFKAAGQIHSEFEMLHKNGSHLFVAFEGRIGYDINGHFKQTHCILQDISERKLAEKKIKSQLDELRRWQDVMLGREGRILELKREVNNLLIEIGRPIRYPSALPDQPKEA